MPIRIEIPGATPPTLNRVGGNRRHWSVWEREKKRWQNWIGAALLVEVQPRRKLTTPVIVDAVLWFPTRRNRDEGNYRSLLEKACGDALVQGGWIDDDNPDHYRFGRITFLKGKACSVLILREGWSVREPASPGLRGGPHTVHHTR